MNPRFIVTGTDTGIGKTIFSAALTGALSANYWKPVQAGLEDETDSQTVLRLGNVAPERIVPEAYRLVTPASPHLAARIDGIEIDVAKLAPPDVDGALVIEGAGGLLVPLTESFVMADLFARWQIPVILCARTTLGTINHTLLSLEALKHRNIPVQGIAYLGDENAESQRIIAKMGNMPSLGRLPYLDDLTPTNLAVAFAANFDLASFAKGP